MRTDDFGIDWAYYDALGGFHQLDTVAHGRLVAAMGLDPAAPPPAADPVRVARGDDRLSLPPGMLLLEDGTRQPHDGGEAALPIGYHHLETDHHRQLLIVAPGHSWLPPGLRSWGWALQLYALRSHRSWGMGDLSDLRQFASWTRSAHGAGIIQLNPLGAALPLAVQQASPYYPSSRRFRNPLYLDPLAIAGAAPQDIEPALAAARRLLDERRIDRKAVFDLKLPVLEAIFAAQPANGHFETWRQVQGVALEHFARFCALAEHFRGGWRHWPDEYRRTEGAAVARFAADHADRVAFHAWLQFQLERQLAAAGAAIPLMHDLAIGFDPNGADAWTWRDLLAEGVSIGAPPDELNTLGQDWGLPPFVPHHLRAAGYEPFISTIRATLRHAGALRIDHVMGLFRLYWIPDGAGPADGGYVRSVPDEYLAILAIESERAQAFIVGEDLGTVEDGVRERLAAEQILGYRVFWFEDRHPADYPASSMATVTTHDLPTLAGLWSGSDLQALRDLELQPSEEGYEQMLHRLRRLNGQAETTPLLEVSIATHAALGASPAAVTLATLEDALLVAERPNVPGTTDQWPNWSLALPELLEAIEASPAVGAVAQALAASRTTVV